MPTPPPTEPAPGDSVPLATIAGQWARLGCIGFGGPPTHIALLRRLCVDDRGWLTAGEFEDGVAATNLLPGPASTQLAILCAWRLRRAPGAVIGGLCFIVPGLALILALAALFLATSAPTWVLGAAAGAGAAVPAVALNAAWSLVPASRARIGGTRSARTRWAIYAAVGALAAATLGTFLVLVLAACGLVEIAVRRDRRRRRPGAPALVPALVGHAAAVGGVGALVWVALKVGSLSYGGGFVVVPLMQHDVVHVYHWMSGPQFLNAVALGQVTPGPVVQTVAVVGYAAGGVAGGLLAAAVAFGPSFLFVILGAPHFDRLRASRSVQAFLTGAGASVIGAIAGSAVPLGLALQHLWQLPVLAAAMVWLLVARRGVVVALLLAGAVGVGLVLAGLPT
jgi:chromate transporter